MKPLVKLRDTEGRKMCAGKVQQGGGVPKAQSFSPARGKHFADLRPSNVSIGNAIGLSTYKELKGQV